MATAYRHGSRLKIKIFVWLLIILAAGAVLSFSLLPKLQRPGQQAEVITVSTLQEIVSVSRLSTYTAVYNGVAQVMNQENPDETDYYVSYEAKVYAGIDFSEVQFRVDEKKKVIYVDLPQVDITKIDVDIASMDFIFYNDKANAATVSQTAYTACEADARRESEKLEDIYLLARQNAGNVLTALIRPIVEQMDPEFSLCMT